MKHARFPIIRFLAAGLFVLGLAGCNGSGGGNGKSGNMSANNIPLTYGPTEHLDVNHYAGLIPGDVKIYIPPISDDRIDKSNIGQNAENSTPPLLYKTADSPTDFVRNGLMKELSGAGLSIVQDQGSASRVLSLSLRKFNSEIHGLFHGDITTNVDIKDASGNSLWKGTLIGHDEHFGRNANLENVPENLSNAVVKLADGILGNPGVQKVLHP